MEFFSKSKLISLLLGSSLVSYFIGRCTTWISLRINEKRHYPSVNTITDTPVKSISILPDGSLTSATSSAYSNETDSVHSSFYAKCQSLFFDMDAVDESYLQSDDQLIASMGMVMDLVDSSNLLTVPKCYRMETNRRSCEMLLPHSHVRLYTWPASGVLCLNMFSCQDASLVLIVPQLTDIFRNHATKNPSEEPKSRVQWAHKVRGNHDVQSTESVGDIEQFLQGWMEYDMKQLVTTVSTEFQTIDIYDVINPRFRSLDKFRASLSNNGSYESMYPELYRPDRIVYLDGIMQSRYYGDAAYHEALVHPAMFTHKNPKRVAIVGGGEGATLREVLKHNTVETVIMIEIDELMVNVSKEHLREWSDCSGMVGSARSCFDDPRTLIFYTDAVAWFIEHYGEPQRIQSHQRFDVVIMDALDPSSSTDFSDILYGNDMFIQSLGNSLNEDGILVAQLGEDDPIDSTGAKHSPKMLARMFIDQLKRQGFQRIQSYTESHGDFLAPWGYMIAFKCADCSLSRWHSNQAMIDLEIQRRSVTAENGYTHHLFRYFDGATLMGYQYPSRVSEEVFCRDLPTPTGCDRGHGLNPEMKHASSQILALRPKKLNSSLIVFSSQDIQKDTYLALDATSLSLLIMPWTTKLMQQYKNRSTIRSHWKFFTFLLEYGYASNSFGETGYFVESSVLLLLNRSCHFIKEKRIPEEETDLAMSATNTFFSRNHWIFQPLAAPTIRDIVAGEEISSADIGQCFVTT